ncbi:HemK family methyltransferase [Phlyctema vagabunda]|uniref:HemK family methyltransferase n=1 Tax=Phlyctema vagabunda TaxID=108571 RepID=A0ABR4PHY3_9HELO
MSYDGFVNMLQSSHLSRVKHCSPEFSSDSVVGEPGVNLCSIFLVRNLVLELDAADVDANFGRPETEAYTTHLAEMLLQYHAEFAEKESFKIIDFCTGSGCIALLLHSLLSPKLPRLKITGVDISPTALALARENAQHNVNNGVLNRLATATGIAFVNGDLLSEKSCQSSYDVDCDIIVSNPPYISDHGFNKETSRSVRNWEPKLALVPCSGENPTDKDCASQDIFYQKIITSHTSSKSRMMLLEVGDSDQAIRVARLAAKYSENCCIQIWRDWPNEKVPTGAPNMINISLQGKPESGEFIGRQVPIVGSGKARSVLIVSGNYRKMLPEIPHVRSFAPPSTSLDWLGDESI